MTRPRSQSLGGFGAAKLIGFASAVCVLLVLTFLFGVLVGREWARSRPPTFKEAGKKFTPVAQAETQDRSGPVQEKLTFYQTLPAPLASSPRESVKKSSPPIKTVGQKDAIPKPESRPAIAQPESRAPKGESTNSTPPPPGSQFWTVQVSAYRSRGLAEELKKSLRTGGYDAYLVQVASEDGKSRYRVRVGSYVSKVEAERVAERLRTERSLSPFVTLKNP